MNGAMKEAPAAWPSTPTALVTLLPEAQQSNKTDAEIAPVELMAIHWVLC